MTAWSDAGLWEKEGGHSLWTLGAVQQAFPYSMTCRFAAEVFEDLHEEVEAIAVRGHELLDRVQHLEVELPNVEKAMLMDKNNFKYFAYTPGMEWRASLHEAQNHFTQGDLPRFIHNAYKECRGPPQLSLLDKFGLAGAEACLKRYTDPTFFKMQWASSELLKAERGQRDKSSGKVKRKGEQRHTDGAKGSNVVFHENSRNHHGPLDAGNIATDAKVHFSSLTSEEARCEQESISTSMRGIGYSEVASSHMPHDHETRSSETMLVSAHINPLVLSGTPLPGDISSRNLLCEELDEDCKMGPKNVLVQEDVAKMSGGYASDAMASDTDDFLDALTTMDSEVETDSEIKIGAELAPSMPSTSKSLFDQEEPLHFDGPCMSPSLSERDIVMCMSPSLSKRDTAMCINKNSELSSTKSCAVHHYLSSNTLEHVSGSTLNLEFKHNKNTVTHGFFSTVAPVESGETKGKLKRNSFRKSESETTERTRGNSPSSSVDLDLQPIVWPRDCPKFSDILLGTDESIYSKHTSSSCDSSSSSAVSSPRPLTLATTFFLIGPDGTLVSPLEVTGPPSSSMCPTSPASLPPVEFVPLHAKTTAQPLSFSKSGSNVEIFDAKIIQSGFMMMNKTEVFPPPPPLPPLEWRTTRRLPSFSSNALHSSPKPDRSMLPVASEPPKQSLNSFPHPSTGIWKATTIQASHLQDPCSPSSATRDQGDNLFIGVAKNSSLSTIDFEETTVKSCSVAESSMQATNSGRFMSSSVQRTNKLCIESGDADASLLVPRWNSEQAMFESMAMVSEADSRGAVFHSVQDPCQQDFPVEADALHARHTLQGRSHSSSHLPYNESKLLFEQIRTRSFSLRRSEKLEQREPPYPVVNISVASILEKANAIRQAFVGSDEDEDV